VSRSGHRTSRSPHRLRAWTLLTLPALLLCCAYASGVLGSVAPRSWHPIQALPITETGLGAPLSKAGFMGVAIPGNSLPAWHNATGIRPQLLMTFEQWYNGQMPTEKLSEDKTVGIRAEMFTWEPWKPAPARTSRKLQGKVQPGLSNRSIADGGWDPYITRWADAIKAFPHITVYIRFGHEMNGTWYPWSHHPRQYVRAWRHIWGIFQQQRVTNAKFVWSASAGMGIQRHKWLPRMRRYWPGGKYVNMVGATMIDFGGHRHTHPVSAFEPRLATMHRLFRKPVLLTEADTQFTGRARWMQDLADYVAQTRWLRGVVWSQLYSRGAGDMPTGDMRWQVTADPSLPARQAFRALARAAARSSAPAGITATAGGGS
jgi:Glycosyl hydrolase family 26